MIPNRASKNEIVGFAMKDRVAACRRRLRDNRAVHRALAVGEMPECGGEYADTADTFLDGYPLVRESTVRASEISEFRDEEAWQPDAQKVGLR